MEQLVSTNQQFSFLDRVLAKQFSSNTPRLAFLGISTIRCQFKVLRDHLLHQGYLTQLFQFLRLYFFLLVQFIWQSNQFQEWLYEARLLRRNDWWICCKARSPWWLHHEHRQYNLHLDQHYHQRKCAGFSNQTDPRVEAFQLHYDSHWLRSCDNLH